MTLQKAIERLENIIRTAKWGGEHKVNPHSKDDIQALRLAIAALRREGELIKSIDLLFRMNPEWLEEHDAPGHSHDVPGIWDKSNGPPDGGTPCEWCQAWNSFRDIYKKASQEPQQEHDADD